MTRPLSLDFIAAGSRLRLLSSVLLAISMCAAGWAALAYRVAVGQMEHQIASAASRHTRDTNPENETKGGREQQEVELKFARRVISQLALPWDRLFTEVEASVDEHITLLGVEPDMGSGTVQISGEADTLPAMLDYCKRLRTHDVFQDASLKSHQINTERPGKPVSFVISAVWRNSLPIAVVQPIK